MISVVLSCFNGEKYIISQLESILCQSIQADEVIICDDRSTDSTALLVKSFIEKNKLTNWYFYQNAENIGYCMNFYKGIDLAKGDIIFLSDQDDIWLCNKLETMSKVMQSNSSIMSLACRYTLIDGEGNPVENKKITYLGDKFDDSIESVPLDSIIGCSCIRGFSMCFNSKIKEYLKPIDLKSLLSHDWYINMLAAMLGKCCVLNTVLCRYRIHGNNTSLTAISRHTLIGEKEKRIRGIEESINAHSYLLSLKTGMTQKETSAVLRLIKCENLRLKFLSTKNLLLFIKLICYPDCYKRYYKSLKGALRVWAGDFLYAYNINMKTK